MLGPTDFPTVANSRQPWFVDFYAPVNLLTVAFVTYLILAVNMRTIPGSVFVVINDSFSLRTTAAGIVYHKMSYCILNVISCLHSCDIVMKLFISLIGYCWLGDRNGSLRVKLRARYLQRFSFGRSGEKIKSLPGLLGNDTCKYNYYY